MRYINACMDDDKLLFFQELREERRLQEDPARCVNLCATGNENLKRYSGILGSSFLPPLFQTGKKLGLGGSRSSEDNNCSSGCLEDNVLQNIQQKPCSHSHRESLKVTLKFKKKFKKIISIFVEADVLLSSCFLP